MICAVMGQRTSFYPHTEGGQDFEKISGWDFPGPLLRGQQA